MHSSNPKFEIHSRNGRAYVTTECREYYVSTEMQQDCTELLTVEICDPGISSLKIPIEAIVELAKRNGVKL
jgi:hypothetical protein